METRNPMNVDIYRHLRLKVWSVRDRATGKVVAHEDVAIVRDATFVVQPGGRRRVLAEGQKNVHAFVRGRLSPMAAERQRSNPDLFRPAYWRAVKYNPFKANHFRYEDTGEQVTTASVVVLSPTGAYVPAKEQQIR